MIKRIFVVALIFWIVIAFLMAKWLIVERPMEKADVIVVLGGSATYLERTEKAASLYREGVAHKIFLTNDGQKAGWSNKLQRNPMFFELATESLLANGVKEEDIEVLPSEVRRTSEEVGLIVRTMQKRNLRSVLVVTSAYHTRRVTMIFDSKKIMSDSKTEGFEIGVVSAPTGQQTPLAVTWWLSPFGWKMIAGEYLKILSFLTFGG